MNAFRHIAAASFQYKNHQCIVLFTSKVDVIITSSSKS